MQIDSYEVILHDSLPCSRAVIVPATAAQYAGIFQGTDSLAADYSFMNALDWISSSFGSKRHSEVHLMMLASEGILRKDWDSPEEDEAWADL